MKVSQIVIILILAAWPLYFLYERQLGAVSFLLLAAFFFAVALGELKKLRQQKKKERKQERQ